MTQDLPAHPHIGWLKRTAKERLKALRAVDPTSKLHTAQLLVARDHGFKTWRDLKARVDAATAARGDSAHVFEAARSGDVDAVSRALAAGFDPATQDARGRTLYQVAKELGHGAIEILVRDWRERDTRAAADAQAVRTLLQAAQAGNLADLTALLDARPDLIDAMGGGLKKATALHLAALRSHHVVVQELIARGADLDARDFPDNASPLHLAAIHGDLETIRLLLDAGADVEGHGDDYHLGILGWATCFQKVRADVAAELLSRGAALNIWSAIALDRADDVRTMVSANPSLLAARMSRNQHRRTPLHHAAAKDKAAVVRVLLERGAQANARDATGASALTTAALDGAGRDVIDALLAAGAPLDFLTALNLERYDAAEALLREDPARIGPEGRDTIALHLAVNKKRPASIRWLLAHGVAVNAKRPMWDCNHTALHMTIESGAADLTQLLLDAGADPNIRDDKFNATALGWARYFARPDLVALLEARGGVV